MLSIDWVEGAPERLEAGMLIQWMGGCLLVGDIDEEASAEAAPAGAYAAILGQIQRWGWLIKPHELEWIEAIGARKP